MKKRVCRVLAAAMTVAMLGVSVPFSTAVAADTISIPTPEPWVNPFADVKEGAYYYNAISWGSRNGIVNGLKPDKFGTQESCTRGQIVTFIWRTLGNQKAENKTTTFTDIVKDSYYYDAVLWAVEAGVVKGLTDTTFGPEQTCTRAELATFIYRAAGSLDIKGNCIFDDVPSGKWYTKPITWGSEQGVIAGYDQTTFGPFDTVLREHTITMLYRYYGWPN